MNEKTGVVYHTCVMQNIIFLSVWWPVAVDNSGYISREW